MVLIGVMRAQAKSLQGVAHAQLFIACPRLVHAQKPQAQHIVAVDVVGTAQCGQGRLFLAVKPQQYTLPGHGDIVGCIQRDRTIGGVQTLGQRIGPGGRSIEIDPRPLDQRDSAPGQRCGRIGFYSLLRQGIGHVAFGTGGFEHVAGGNRPGAQRQAISREVFRPRLARPVAFGVVNLGFNRADDGAGDFFLHIKNVGQYAVVFFGPDVVAARRVN